MSDEKPPAEGRDRERPNDQRPIRPKVNYATVSEAALVDAMRTGEARAIEEFIVRYQRLLIDRARTAGLRPRDCADAIADVVPDVAMRVVARRLAAAQAFFRTFRRNLTARLSPEGPPADKEPEDQRANEGSAAARGTPGPCPDPNNPACKKGGTMTINVGGAAAFLAFGGNLEMGVAFNRSGDLLLYVKGGVSYGLGVAGGPEIGVNRGSLDDVTARTGYEGGGFEFAGAGGIASGSVTISEEGRNSRRVNRNKRPCGCLPQHD